MYPLLILVQTAGGLMPSHGDPKERLRQLMASLFVQDTLSQVMRGPLPQVVPHPIQLRVDLSDPNSEKLAMGTDAGAQDTLVAAFPVFFELTPKQQEGSLVHEMGHILRWRDPELRAKVEKEFLKAKAGTYAATNPPEHFAEAFRDAMEAVREGRKKTTIPGAEILRKFILNTLKAQPSEQ